MSEGMSKLTVLRPGPEFSSMTIERVTARIIDRSPRDTRRRYLDLMAREGRAGVNRGLCPAPTSPMALPQRWMTSRDPFWRRDEYRHRHRL
jgi:hypothetical protein